MDQGTPLANGDDAPADHAPAPGGDADVMPTDGGGPGDAPGGDAGSALSWNTLRNPFYAHDAWSVKDVAVSYGPDGVIHVYFSAFFMDAGMERCHVAQTSTRDLRTFTPAVVIFDGQSVGWIGMCSADVQRICGTNLVTFNPTREASPPPKHVFFAAAAELNT